ncbi:MAG: polyamine aminopropyltransferase [Bdellovibrionota bacterium]
MQALGRHILVEFTGCLAEVLNDVAVIEKSMIEAAQIAGATVINTNFHHFSPWGVSGVVVIQESHLTIHTWPEYRYAAVDLFTCGETVDPWVSFEHLKKVFQANYSAIEMNRGSHHLVHKAEIKFNPLRMNDSKPIVDQKYKIERNVWFTDKDEKQALSLRYKDVLFNEMTPYQQVRVFDTFAYGKMLTINNMIMCTERDESHYHEMIVHPTMQLLKTAKNILVIGGGDGGTIREVFKYASVEKVTMVEIDEAVIRASREHLPKIASAFGNPKLELIVGDGIDFIAKAKADSYDLIIVDGSDPVGPAKGLFSADFYKNCHKALRKDGAVITQGESPMFHQETFVELHRCLEGIFGEARVHTILFHATTYPTGMWSLQLATKSDLDPLKNFDQEKAKKFCDSQELHYYNEDLHRAVFTMPTFVRKMLAGKN